MVNHGSFPGIPTGLTAPNHGEARPEPGNDGKEPGTFKELLSPEAQYLWALT